MGYWYIAATVFFTVYGQLILKWRIIGLEVVLPEAMAEKIFCLVKLVFDPFIMSGYISAFLASLFWMAAMTKFDVSYAYPFISLAFVLVFLFSVLLFNEPATLQKVLGLCLIAAGIYVTSQSA